MKTVQFDQLIKKFEPFTDPEQMKDLFQKKLPLFSKGRLTITDCKIGDTRFRGYKKVSNYARSTLSITYDLNVTEPSTRRSGQQIFYAKAYLEGRSKVVFQEMKSRQRHVPLFGQALTHLPELDMIVWAFPNDPALPHLPNVVDAEKVKQHFPYQLLSKGIDSPDDIQDLRVEVAHYQPESRCTTCYTLQYGPRNQLKTFTLYGKTFNDDSGRAVHARVQFLKHSSLEQPDAFLVAKPLGYDKTLKTLWQEGLPGVPAIQMLNGENDLPLLKSIAKGLANLHKSNLTSPLRITVNDHLEEMRTKVKKIIYAFPRTEKTLEPLVETLTTEAPHLNPSAEVLIHNDFHIGQLIVHENKIAFFDFDEFAIGDPMQDLADFIVDLHLHGYGPSRLKQMIAVFFHEYRSKVDWAVPEDRLNWHLKVQFITKAYRYYIQQKPNLEAEIQGLISLAQQGIYTET